MSEESNTCFLALLLNIEKACKKGKNAMKSVAFTEIPLSKRPEAKVWQVLAEQASQGQAVLLQDGDSYLVQFPDEAETIPFDRLGYHAVLGLYDKQHFSDL